MTIFVLSFSQTSCAKSSSKTTGPESSSSLLVQADSAKQSLPRVYDEKIDPTQQVNDAIAQAKRENKHVILQLGGNWCIWCLRFADFITKDEEIASFIAENYVYAHVNYPRSKVDREAFTPLMKRLGNPQRFGFPVLIVLDGEGNRLHIQDSSFLEKGMGYNRDYVLRFLKAWTPAAL